MFPVPFVREAVERWCPPSEGVLDPFCGRGTVPYVARITGRPSWGIDLNAVAYVFSAAKTDPEPNLERVQERIKSVAAAVRSVDEAAVNVFQALAWTPRVLGFLNAARRVLDWRESRLDRTLMALILVHLHAKAGNAVSNQMRQSKSMAPDYAVRWWTEHGMLPPDLDPARYFHQRAAWRYRFGVPQGAASTIAYGDARQLLPYGEGRFSMLLTSPPYYGITNYRVDNWIHLWMLGEGALPEYTSAQRYGNKPQYLAMLHSVFAAAKPLLDSRATIYVRTDSRDFTRNATRNVLEELWPDYRCFSKAETPKRSQTDLFGGKESGKLGETDFLMLPAGAAAPHGFDVSLPTSTFVVVRQMGTQQ